MQPKVLIMMRFQYAMRSLVTKSMSYDEICEYVFQDDRLKQRFWLFENICRPALLAQTDKNFRLVILSSPSMPDWAKARLFDLLEPFDADIIWDENTNWIKAFQKYLDENFSHQTDPIMTMRLDDDDAISIEWVRTLNELALVLAPIADRVGSVTLYATRGVVIDSNNASEPIKAVWTRTPTVGMSRLVRAGQKGHAYSYEHNRSSEKDFVFSTPAPYSFVRVLHQSNISHMHKSPHLANFRVLDDPPETIMQKLEENFALNVSLFEEWPDYEDSQIRIKSP